MFLIYAQTEALGREVAQFVADPHIVATDWGTVRGHSRRAYACILVFHTIGASDVERKLEEVRRWTIHAPITLVLPFSEDHATALASVRVERVVWFHHLANPHEASALFDAVHKTLQQRFAEAILTAVWIQAESRGVVAALCMIDPPPENAKVAARALGLSGSALRRRVSGAFAGLPGRTLELLLEWLRLLWACDPARANQKQRAVARMLGRDSRTLQRTALRRTGQRLTTLCSDPESVLRSALDAHQLDAATDDSSSP